MLYLFLDEKTIVVEGNSNDVKSMAGKHDFQTDHHDQLPVL